jgi:uroporphyrinogen III methyltransferase/synthase
MSVLEGRRVAITRAEGQAGELGMMLKALGATPLPCPTIRVIELESYAELDAALVHLDSYGWVVFTSVNGVTAVLKRLGAIGLAPFSMQGVSVAAVGPQTAVSLYAAGIQVAHVPPVHRAESLAESLSPIVGEKVLLARADLATPVLSDRLLARGAAQVDDVTAYRTVPLAPEPAALRELECGVDAIVFTSPSTVRGFLMVGPEWRSLIDGAIVASVGPVTTLAAREAGLEVHVEGGERTMESLVDGLVRSFLS